MLRTHLGMFESAWQNLAQYPRWFVVLCAVLVGAGLLWLFFKVIKWTVSLVLMAAVIVGILVLLFWWLG